MFYSILYPSKALYEQPRTSNSPDCFKDLNLDQIVNPLLKNSAIYQLDEFYFSPLIDSSSIIYRQDVFRELEEKHFREIVIRFSDKIFSLNNQMNALRAEYERDGWNMLFCGQLLNYTDEYCRMINSMNRALQKIQPVSDGMSSFTKYLQDYCMSERFLTMSNKVDSIRKDFSELKYCMNIQQDTIRVLPYEDEVDIADEIIILFEKFHKSETHEYRKKLSETPVGDHVEKAVLQMLTYFYPEKFKRLEEFAYQIINYEDSTISRFVIEVQFYLKWLELIDQLKAMNLPFHYPVIETKASHFHAEDSFDLALALKIGNQIVTNSWHITFPEQLIVITGPNQGGKTTFARAFGQSHFLARLGLCIPGTESHLILCDNIFTHFEQKENLENLNGKLKNELLRLKMIFEQATSKSIIIINEIFSSTTEKDALLLSDYMMRQLIQLGSPSVLVTFLDALADYQPQAVSMVSTYDLETKKRTFHIIRKKADGLAYALDMAYRYGLTYSQLKERLL